MVKDTDRCYCRRELFRFAVFSCRGRGKGNELFMPMFALNLHNFPSSSGQESGRRLEWVILRIHDVHDPDGTSDWFVRALRGNKVLKDSS